MAVVDSVRLLDHRSLAFVNRWCYHSNRRRGKGDFVLRAPPYRSRLPVEIGSVYRKLDWHYHSFNYGNDLNNSRLTLL